MHALEGTQVPGAFDARLEDGFLLPKAGPLSAKPTLERVPPEAARATGRSVSAVVERQAKPA